MICTLRISSIVELIYNIGAKAEDQYGLSAVIGIFKLLIQSFILEVEKNLLIRIPSKIIGYLLLKLILG